jgi:hypothetical protein
MKGAWGDGTGANFRGAISAGKPSGERVSAIGIRSSIQLLPALLGQTRSAEVQNDLRVVRLLHVLLGLLLTGATTNSISYSEVILQFQEA